MTNMLVGMNVWLRFWAGGGKQSFMKLDDHCCPFCVFLLYDNCIVDYLMSYGTRSNLHLSWCVKTKGNVGILTLTEWD